MCRQCTSEYVLNIMKLLLILFVVLTVLSTLCTGQTKRLNIRGKISTTTPPSINNRFFVTLLCPGGGLKTKSGICLTSITTEEPWTWD